MSSQKDPSRNSRGAAADAAAAASRGSLPPPLPLPPGVSFESLRGRLKPSARPPGEGEQTTERGPEPGSVSSRIEAINQRINDGVEKERNAEFKPPVRPKIRFAPRVQFAGPSDVEASNQRSAFLRHTNGSWTGSSSSSKAGSAPEPAKAELKPEVAGAVRAAPDTDLGPTALRDEHPVNSSEDSQSPIVETTEAGISVEGQGIAEASDIDELSEFDPLETAQETTKASLLQLSQLTPQQVGTPYQPSEEALVDKIQRLLPDMDAFTSECDELFSACTAGSGNEFLTPQELYDLTQRLIDLFGCRDTDVLERISLIYSSVEQTCGPDSGMGVVELRGYIASVLTQILHELESRSDARSDAQSLFSEHSLQYIPSVSRESSFCILPQGSLEPEPRVASHSGASPGLGDVFTWLPGRPKSEKSAEASGGAFDLVRNGWASVRASFGGWDVFQGGVASKEAPPAKGEAASADAKAAVEDCVARATVEIAQDIFADSDAGPSMLGVLATEAEGAKGSRPREGPGRPW